LDYAQRQKFSICQVSGRKVPIGSDLVQIFAKTVISDSINVTILWKGLFGAEVWQSKND